MRYKHITGIEGVFVKFYRNRFGEGMLIKLDNGREYFAPVDEFILI